MSRIIRKLPVPIFLGMSFIDRFIMTTFPSDEKVVLFNASPVAILKVHKTVTEQIEE